MIIFEENNWYCLYGFGHAAGPGDRGRMRPEGGAASLTDVLKQVDSLYMKEKPNVTVTANFGGSGALQKQIENGAPVDLFLSAAAQQMDALQKEQLLLDGARKDLLGNKVVLVVPDDSTLGITDFKDLASDKVKKVAIGEPKSVSCGMYAEEVFTADGIAATVNKKVVEGSDVRVVLTYVESGNVDAGVVFQTDANTSTKVKDCVLKGGGEIFVTADPGI
jgi:molybdate transport system substrate-binding protein